MTLKEQMLEIVNQADDKTLQQFLKLWQNLQKPPQKGFMRFSGILKDHADILIELEQEIDQNRQTSNIHKPIWEIAAELTQDIPAEIRETLPTDGAAQHDHYLYDTPKRP